MDDKTLKSELWEENSNTQPRRISLTQDENDKCGITVEISKKSENKTLKDTTLKRGEIYLITNNVTGGKYVGQTIQPLKQRWLDHQRNAFKRVYRSPLYSAIRKYGIDNFSINCIETIHEENPTLLAVKLNEREIHFIEIHNTFISNHSESGYNLTTGGGNCRFSDESKKKMSDTHKARWTAERMQEQSQRSLSLWKTKEYRKTHRESMETVVTDEFRKKISDLSKKVWSSSDYRDKMSKQRKQLYLDNESVRKNLVREGSRNGRYDHTIYEFKNSKTSETYIGTQFELAQRFDNKKAARVKINGLVRGRNEQYLGWKLK